METCWNNSKRSILEEWDNKRDNEIFGRKAEGGNEVCKIVQTLIYVSTNSLFI
jgi:hypothetical protein